MGLDTEYVWAWVSHFCSAYYVLHYLAFLVFLYVRWLLSTGGIPRTMEEEHWLAELEGSDLLQVGRETQIWGCWALIVMSRCLRWKSLTDLVGGAIGFAKACVCVSLFIADWYLPLYFLGLWVVLFFVTSQPAFETPRRKFVKMDRRKIFDVVFNTVEQDKEAAQVYWFINVWASWQKGGSSKEFNPVFADLSSKYTNDFCKFVKVDAGRMGGQAVIKKLEIDDSALSKHMPSLLLFKNGKEIARLPPKNKDNASYLHEYKQHQIEQYFNVENIHKDTQKRTEKRRADRAKMMAESKKNR
eukprot:TRINITY_DN24944_c0_g1_i1.p1 TRINITY_DN24944_c0_g1~~TRINITY_DN24944_c0_g1_i1.p1  ORF type:complete len:300 (+),score=141.13 TRINITY_DN24944_c0_g1_i1:57-956(+)